MQKCKILRSATLTLIIIAAISQILVGPSLVYAQSDEEKALFDTLKSRYQDGQAPQSVQSIIDSFTAEQTYTCPHGHETPAQIKFSAKLVAWNPPEGYENHDGLMSWSWKYEQIGPPKIVNVTLEVMFNLAKMQPKEGNQFGRILNDAIFYHEMLHGWLAVHGKMRNEKWCKEFCECRRDFETGTEAEHHNEISPWQDTYTNNLATAAGYTVIEHDEQAHPRGDGTFSVPTGLTKESLGWDTVEDWLDNVEIEAIEWDSETNQWVIKGKLKDKNKPGKLKVYIDPSSYFLILNADIYPPAPVGGIAIPVDKLGLLASYIALTSTILVATVATAIYVKRIKRRKEKQ